MPWILQVLHEVHLHVYQLDLLFHSIHAFDEIHVEGRAADAEAELLGLAGANVICDGWIDENARSSGQ